MAYEIKVPSFGESITESTVAQWLKQDGEWVNKGEALVSLDTEKASEELNAEVSGVLHIKVPAGADVSIGAVIGEIEERAAVQAGERPPSMRPQPRMQEPPRPKREDGATAVPPVQPAAPPRYAPEPALQPPEVQEQAAPLHMAAPTPEKVAERGVGQTQELETVQTLPGGGREQVPPGQASAAPQPQGPPTPLPGAAEAAQAPWTAPAATPPPPLQAAAAPPEAASAPAAQQAPPAPSVPEGGETREPMSRLRRTIAQQMLRARCESAMLTTFTEVDMSHVMAMRTRHQENFQKQHGVKLGFMSFFVKASVEALRAYPIVNASIERDDIIYHHYYNIGVAVSTERGLVVPVIANCERKSFAEIERELAELAGRARAGKISLDELKNGTFTITNGGIFGSMLSTPLLNPPQVAILGMHAITERPVAVAGKVEIRPMMYLALSYDHRLVDGREAVLFLMRIKEHVTDPERMLLGL